MGSSQFHYISGLLGMMDMWNNILSYWQLSWNIVLLYILDLLY